MSDVVGCMVGPDGLTMDQLRDPNTIISVLKELGWTRIGSDHTYDCPTNIDSGLRCNCVPDADSWTPPNYILKAIGQDWDSRLARKKAKEGPPA